ncbi:MAG: MBL fold metallo-hydrolase [candidate division WOR-3 bacterium]
MTPEEYFKKDLNKSIEIENLKVTPVWFDSMGAKSMCTFIESPEVKIIIDPGFAIMQPSYPLKENEKLLFLEAAEKRVKEFTKRAEIVIITHYHYDHHKRPIEFPESYINKTLYIKNPNEWINYSQWERTRIMYEDLINILGKFLNTKDLYEEPKEKEYKDPYEDLKLVQKKDFGDYSKRREQLLKIWRNNMFSNATFWKKELWLREFEVEKTKINFIKKGIISFGLTNIYFPGPFFHGIEYAKTGWVEPLLIERKGVKILFSSDIMGPNIEDYAWWIIDENPNVIILDGPSTYLLGYMFNQVNLDRCIENVSRIIKETNFDIMIYDHHLLREKTYKEHMGDFYILVEKIGKRVITAAEWFGLNPLVELL